MAVFASARVSRRDAISDCPEEPHERSRLPPTTLHSTERWIVREGTLRTESFQAVASVLAAALVITSVPAYPAEAGKPINASPASVLDSPAPASGWNPFLLEEASEAVEAAPLTPLVSELGSAASASPSTTPPPPPPSVTVNKTVPVVEQVPEIPEFPEAPSDADITAARVFGEPFVPLGGQTSGDENAAFADAILTYLQNGNNEDTSAFGTFLTAYPNTAWKASLFANLGAHYQRTGYYTQAGETLQDAWNLAREPSSPAGLAVALTVLSELLDLKMKFGDVEELKTILSQSEGLELHGTAVEKVAQAEMAVYVLEEVHEEAVASGSVSVDNFLRAQNPGYRQHPEIASFKAKHEGTSLAEVQELAGRTGLAMQMARRPVDQNDIPVPSIIHLKAGHFSAVVKQMGERFMLLDPMLGGEMWFSRAALQTEASGYFLVPRGNLPPGWTEVKPNEAQAVRGKCQGAIQGTYKGEGARPPCEEYDPEWPCCLPEKMKDECCIANGEQQGQQGAQGMAFYAFNAFMGALDIFDNPVGYLPPRGPAVRFLARYHQRDGQQPQTFTFSNLGRRWRFPWLSYLEDDPSNPYAQVSHIAGKGSKQTYSGFNGTSFAPEINSRAILTRTSSSPIRYERQLPDGSLQVFSQSDGGVSPRRVFMTEWRDARGNAAVITFDSQLRIVSISDSLSQVTTLSYELTADPLKVTKVTDPFGRSAKLEYDGAGALVRITDVIGIVSAFEYGQFDFIRALTTPYGTTTFVYGSPLSEQGAYYNDWWVEATDPLGGKQRMEYNWKKGSLPATEAANTVPAGFINNANLNLRNSYYWDKRAMMLHPGDYTKAKVMHWLWSPNNALVVTDALHSEKEPLENRVWYGQEGESVAEGASPSGQPSKVGRVLDDGTSQIYRYEYNSKGRKTRVIDPLGRETIVEYATNENDLLNIKQKNGSNYDLLEQRTYNTQHEPLTVTDAAGQVTTYTYNSQGQLLTVVTPPRGGLSQAERTTTYAYDTNGYLQSVTGPLAGATTSYTYDSYGRVRTITDSDSYAITIDYDALDRKTKTTYPDATYEQIVYNRLDGEKRRDRLGRWTETFYDALRRVVATRDSLGRTTTQEWCACGSLDRLIDPKGNATSWERDLQGRVTKETRPDGNFWESTYETTTSRLKKSEDAKGQETQYSYFLDNKVQQVSYPTAEITTPSVSYAYDAGYGRLATMVDGTGTTNYSYHPVATAGAGQLASVDGPLTNDTVSYAYDELGRVSSRTLNGTTTNWSYDALGRLTTLGDPLGNFTHAYVGVTGRLSSLTYPNGQTSSYAYMPNSGDKRLQEIHHRVSSGGVTLSKFSYAYDAAGSITQWTQQYGTAAANAYDLSYDAAEQLTAGTYRTTDPTPTVLKRYGYAYDAAGNRTTAQIDDAPMQSTFDNRNRLTSEQPGGALVLKGSVNEQAAMTVAGTPAEVDAGNKFEGTAPMGSGTSNVVVTATDASGNLRTNTYQVTISGSTTSFSYDANGSLTGVGTKTYEWDGANRMVRVLDGGNEVVRFVYDGQGRRSQKTAAGVTRTYVYDNEDVVEERLSTGATIRYVHGPGIDQPVAKVEAGTTSYYLADHLGSIVQTTDASATVTLTRQYDAGGNPLQGSGTAGYAFTGREWDPEAQLYYYRARWYDAKVGRFISEDPLRFHTGSTNFYDYVKNNTVNFTDPMGLEAMPPGGLPCGSTMSNPTMGPGPPKCNPQNATNAARRVRNRMRLTCSGTGLGGGTTGPADIDENASDPYAWYVPSNDACVDYCRCVHETTHLRRANTKAITASKLVEECQAYREQLACLKKRSCGGL
jgi:RHS repeat-associated protein